MVLIKKMRHTTINEFGTYHAQLNVGNTQSLSFITSAFQLRKGRVSTSTKLQKKKIKENKKMLVNEIKASGYKIRGHLSKDELERIAQLKNIELTYKFNVKKEGWMGKPKGLLQIFWERGYKII